MSAPVWLNVIGHPGSGKSKVCEYLANTHGFEVYCPSDIIRAQAPLLGLALRSRSDYARCNLRMVEQDPDAFIRPVLESSAARLCIDGLRSPRNADSLRELGMLTLALVVPAEVRYARVYAAAEREGHRKPPTFEAFLADEQTDSDTTDSRLPNTQVIIDGAEYSIDADQPLATVYTHVDHIVTEILKAD